LLILPPFEAKLLIINSRVNYFESLQLISTEARLDFSLLDFAWPGARIEYLPFNPSDCRYRTTDFARQNESPRIFGLTAVGWTHPVIFTTTFESGVSDLKISRYFSFMIDLFFESRVAEFKL